MCKGSDQNFFFQFNLVNMWIGGTLRHLKDRKRIIIIIQSLAGFSDLKRNPKVKSQSPKSRFETPQNPRSKFQRLKISKIQILNSKNPKLPFIPYLQRTLAWPKHADNM